jgi:GR25 family glycosyltransferase involved in LPS biosynthesis
MSHSIKNMKDIKNIFYINLETRPDRKSHFENEMKKLGWSAARFNAIKHKFGALGCSMSHLSLLKYAKQNNLDHILIMEDDISFLYPEIFVKNLNSFLSSEKEFDVLLIAGNNMGPYEKINEYCVKIKKCQTTTGYLVKRNYYDILIANIEQGVNYLSNNLNRLNDFAIDQYWNKLQLKDNWLLLIPLTVTQRPDYSNIEKRVINYNRVMLDLDKKELRHIGIIKERVIIKNTLNDIIHNN